jgi:hypothetical protein
MLVNAARLDTSRVPCVVEGMFPAVGSGIVHGQSSTGKSYAFLTKLALDVANGVPFFGHETIQGTVVVALGEGLQDAGLRIKAQLAQHAEEVAARHAEILDSEGQDAADEFAAGQLPYTDQFLVVETQAFDMPFQNGKPSVSMQQFLASISGVGPVMVIYDALADFAGDASIVNETAANRYVAGIKHMVAELDCFVLGIAHDTAKGDKMIGSGRFKNAADVMMGIKAQQGEMPVSTVIAEKVKYGKLGPAFSYTALEKKWDEPVIDDHGFPTGETELVETHVVVLQDENADGPAFVLPEVAKSVFAPTMLPAMQDVQRPKSKRNGIKIATGLSLEERAARVEKMLSVPCHECGAPATGSCNPIGNSQFSTIAPGIKMHISRAAQQKTAEKVTA